jgi:hypothetical protein
MLRDFSPETYCAKQPRYEANDTVECEDYRSVDKPGARLIICKGKDPGTRSQAVFDRFTQWTRILCGCPSSANPTDLMASDDCIRVEEVTAHMAHPRCEVYYVPVPRYPDYPIIREAEAPTISGWVRCLKKKE